jgi:hypothetical protein
MARCPALQVQTECGHAGPVSILSDRMPHSHQVLIETLFADFRPIKAPPLYSDPSVREILMLSFRNFCMASWLWWILSPVFQFEEFTMRIYDVVPTEKFRFSKRNF